MRDPGQIWIFSTNGNHSHSSKLSDQLAIGALPHVTPFQGTRTGPEGAHPVMFQKPNASISCLRHSLSCLLSKSLLRSPIVVTCGAGVMKTLPKYLTRQPGPSKAQYISRRYPRTFPAFICRSLSSFRFYMKLVKLGTFRFCELRSTP
jgi:hypothetical protein